MKKISFLSIVFIFLSISSTAAQVRVGALMGINSTGFSGDKPPNSSFSSSYGYDVGLSSDFYILEDVVINIQSIYSNKSTNVQYDVRYQYEPYDSISVKSTYFEIPMNIKVISDNKISYVKAGISLGVHLQTEAQNNRTGNKIDTEDRFIDYVWYANFGVGIQFSVGKPMMTIELHYTQSLTNLTSLKIKEISLNNKLKSNGLRLHAGLLFTL
jgi:hypothetical protein